MIDYLAIARTLETARQQGRDLDEAAIFEWERQQEIIHETKEERIETTFEK